MKFFTQKKFKFLVLGLFFSLFIFGLFLSLPTLAQTNIDTLGVDVIDENVALGGNDFRITIVKIINTILSLLGIVAVVIILYGGFVYMTAGGEDDKVSKARKIIINGVIGLAIILSSWAITKFVLNKLGQATGLQNVVDTSLDGDCFTPGTPYYEKYSNTLYCQDIVDDFPDQNCTEKHFIAKSITPSTKLDDVVGMNDVVIRAVFSREVGSSLNNAIKIEKDGIDITGEFSFAFKENNQVIEVTSITNDGCDSSQNEKCIFKGNYVVRLLDIKDKNGNPLEVDVENCGTYPKDASFKVGSESNILDNSLPVITNLKLNNLSGDNVRVAPNKYYPISVSVNDRSNVIYGGNSYVLVKVYKKGSEQNILKKYLNGPMVSFGSSAEFSFNYALLVKDTFEKNVDYVIDVTAYDIDNNFSNKKLEFRVVPESCFNNIQDLNETGIDEGGNCGSDFGSSCNTQSDCSLSYKCLNTKDSLCSGTDDCLCKKWPYIENVEFMNGATGNWITILGKNFGQSNGEISFNYDTNNDGNIDFFQNLSLAECRVGDMWNDNWIIAEVPAIPADIDVALVKPSISVKNLELYNNSLGKDINGKYWFSDFTNDSFGTNLGKFEFNNTKRPGLCAVNVVGSEQTMAEPKKDIEAVGKAFGTNGKMFFGINEVAIKSWSDNYVQAVVPFVSKGKYGVFVQVNGEKSNAVPFSVVETGSDKLPLILKIDPVTTTPGSYITITGNDFGSSYGKVFINGKESSELPIYCGNTWSDKQIIVKVPLDSDIGKLNVVVQTINNKSTVGDNFVNIVSGSAQPSLCKIEPAKGSAPLEENKKLILKGDNFSITPTFYFWKADKSNIKENDKETWLKSSFYTSVISDKEVKISIPVDSEDGKSMTSGPIVVGASGKFSNSINYEVIDCRLLGNDIPSGFQCCSVGSESGVLKTNSEVCADSVRDAGYAWRFTTGKIPEKFYVLEQCKKGVVPPVPSPTPWSVRDEGKNVCVNASIQVAFSLPVKDDSENRNNFHIYECGNSSDISLASCIDVTNTKFDILINSGLVNFQLKDRQNLSANTWYNIALSQNLISQKVVTELSLQFNKNEKLQKTRECTIGGKSFAYCFDFKTGNSENLCTLVSAGIYPSLYESKFLGVLQDVRWPLISNLVDIFNIGNPNLHPQFFNVYGLGNQECVVMNVDGLGWSWGPNYLSSVPVTSEKYTTTIPRYIDSRGVATAWSGTPVEGSEISATLTTSTKSIVATSTIKVELANPRVVSTWPLCLEACINAEIGAQFNQLMIKDSYEGNVRLYKCSNEDCDNKVLQSINISPNSDYQNLRFYNNTNLSTSTWYLVELTEGIVSVGDARQVTQAGGISLKPGKPLPKTTWKFKTKDSSEPCIVDKVSVTPNPFYAYFVGQKTQYTAQARGAVDNCSPNGQLLNPWNYGWEWSVKDTNIADITNFSISNNFNINFCSLNCLPSGSDVSIKTGDTYPVCGNGIVDSGEDCDIAMGGEIVGVSCSYNCLRPGNKNTVTCGNGIVEKNLGEECDPNSENVEGREGGYCSNICLRVGSKQEVSNVSSAPICGSGNITYGEDCDIKDPNSSKGCSNICLNSGTDLSQVWCDSRNPMSPSDNIACKNALSICGNGEIESGEECELGKNGANENNCNSRCLLTNVCGHILEQCEKGDEGCNDDCTLKGSSLSYTASSLCGDGVLGTGESNRCELVLESDENLISSPVQIITAKGDSPDDVNSLEIVSAMSTKIFAKPVKYYFRDQNNIEKSLEIKSINGEADYSLMCGYEEYIDKSEDSKYNDCPNNSENNLGVASNSCCYNRPVRSSQYPAVNAEGVCRNTYIEVQFPKLMNKLSFENNVSIVQGYDRDGNYANYECSQHQQIDVTTEVNQYLGITESNGIVKGFWQKVWFTIKDFFVKLFTGKVFALENVEENNDLSGRDIVWCASSFVKVAPNVIYEDNNSVTTTIAGLLLSNLLDSNVYVLVVLNGDKDGIKDFNNVGIKNAYSNIREDFWLFKTGNDICKVDKIEVDPINSVFNKPNDSKDFKINVVSKNSLQKITRIANVYDWQYSWHPTNNPIFNIPNIDNSTNIISSKNVEGQMDGLAQVKITKDISAENSDEGRTFSANFYLQSFFCSNIWPSNLTSVSGSSASQASYSDNLFRDNKFNFSFLYCADNNNPLLTEDDLPLFDNVVLSNNNLDEYGVGDTALGRYLMFSSTTNDALGIQIFENVPSSNGKPRSLTQWYTDKFESLGDMKPSIVGGYEALSNGNNYYVSVYDVDKARNGNLGTVYNYVILFSLTNNFSQDSSKVFSQIIENVKFNTKMTDFGKCLLSGNNEEEVRSGTGEISEVDCNTDFDCRDTSGLPLSGTAGFCHNEITKFYRDLNRLSSLSVSQYNLDNYFNNDLGKSDFVGDLKSGSFVYGYSNSKWQNSWGLLNSYAGTLAVDPVNQWAGCTDHDPLTCWNAASSTYACPNFAQIYEYKFVSSTQSYSLYAPFEYLQSGQDSDFVKRYIDINKVNFGRFCEAGALTSLTSVCGDNLISTSAGEECEPPNSTKLLSSYRGNSCSVPGTRYLATCNPNTCTWNVSSSCTEKVAVCGNRIVETGEECDEGVLNGKYGHCGSNCKLPLSDDYEGAGSCGDEVWQSSTELCDINESRYLTGYCEFNKNKVCSTNNDCKENFSSVETPKYETKQSLCAKDKNTGLSICSGGVTKPVSCSGPEDSICRTYDSNSTCIEQDGNKICSGRVSQPISCLTNLDCVNSKGEKLTYQEQVGVNVVEAYTTDYGACLSLNETTYDFKKDNTCSYDCRTRAGYCGDGIKQSQYEQCDDSNNNNGDGCDFNCNIENFCTYPYSQNTLSCKNDNNCPMSKISIAGKQKFILSNSNKKVCLSNESNLIYTPIDNSDVVEPFYCESDADCRDQETYLSRVTYIQSVATTNLNFNNIVCLPISDMFGFDDSKDVQCLAKSAEYIIPEQSQEVANIVSPSCGNGVRDFTDTNKNGTRDDGENWIEQCDVGSQNGVECNPTYGQSCTYCNSSCVIQTKESAMRCGNGIVDKDENGNWLEVCDYNLTGSIQSTVISRRDDDLGEVSCLAENYDAGNYQCINNCQTLQNNCVSCGLGNNLPLARLAIINPMVAGGNSNYTTQPYVALLKKNSNNTNSFVANVWRKINFAGNVLISSAEPNSIIVDSVSVPLTNGTGLETSSQCNYKLFFNPFSYQFMGGSNTVDAKVEAGLGDLFDYPVNNEVSYVDNEVIMSPAVPEDSIRVVIRWKKNGGINFVGNFYSDKIEVENIQDNSFRYIENADKTYDAMTNLVGNTSTPNEYVLPEYANNHSAYTDAVARFYFHPLINTEYSGTQAMTFSAKNLNLSVSSTLGFYVSSPNGPINQLRNNDVWVEVYRHHPNQVPSFSIYKPDLIFKLSNAKSSGYALASYWHVFNIYMNENRIALLPIGKDNIYVPMNSEYYLNYNPFVNNYGGAIVNGECEVRKAMPNTTPCNQ